MKILLKNADIYFPKHYGVGDILIENEIIKKIDKNISTKADEIIDCSNKIISPMFVDGHEHLLGNYWSEEGIISSGVGSVVACLANEQDTKCVEKLVSIANRIKKEHDIDAYCLTGSKNFIDDNSKFILNNTNVIGIKTALFQPQRPKPNLSYNKLKNDVISTFEAGNKTGKSIQVHIHLDHPFARGEKVSIEDIETGKLDNLNWIDKIVKETGVPYSIFKLTHAQKYYNRILEYANKGCFIDYTAFHGEYDNRYDCLIDAIKQNKVDTTKISISSDLGMMAMERKWDTETPLSLLNTIQKLLAKGLKLEQVLPMVTTNALKPIKNVENLIKKDAQAKLLILNKDLEIEKIVLKDNMLTKNKDLNIKN